MNPIIAAYFRELLQRLGTKSPQFIRVLQFFMACLTFAGMIPTALCEYFYVDIPEGFVKLCRDIAKVSLGFFLGGFFTADSKPVALKEDGEILKQTDEKRMPFTKMCEDKEKQKLKDVPKVVEVIAIKEDEASFAEGEEKKEE